MNRKYNKSLRSGWTLIELMLAVSLLLMILPVLMRATGAANDSVRFVNDGVLLNENALRAFDEIRRELMYASSSSIAIGESGMTFSSYSVANSEASGEGTNLVSKSIVLDSEDLNGDGRHGSQLILVDGDRYSVLANNISEVIFSRIQNEPVVKVQMKFDATPLSTRPRSLSFQTQISVINQ